MFVFMKCSCVGDRKRGLDPFTPTVNLLPKHKLWANLSPAKKNKHTFIDIIYSYDMSKIKGNNVETFERLRSRLFFAGLTCTFDSLFINCKFEKLIYFRYYCCYYKCLNLSTWWRNYKKCYKLDRLMQALWGDHIMGLFMV